MPSLSETLWNYLQPRPGSATDGLRNQLASLLTGWSSKTSTPGTPKHNANVWLEEAARNLDSAIGGPERNRLRAVGPHDPTLDAQDRESLNQKMLNFVLNLGPQATVWHGSPHDIQPKPGGKYPEFDISKIGTGEGAQAYGHGLYMAEAQEVGQTYAPANQKFMDKVASLIDKSSGPKQEVLEMFNKLRLGTGFGSPAGIKQRIERIIENEGASPEYASGMRKAFNQIEKQYLNNPGGYLYKVDIPDEAIPRMLDWDKPLSQQAPEVQKAIKSSPIGTRPDIDALSGNSLHDLLMFDAQDKVAAITGKARNGSQQDAVSSYLASQGIPGIRYLDGGSRGAGQGTSNYVLFDDKLPRILEKNGVPTGQTPWTPEEWAAYLSGGGK